MRAIQYIICSRDNQISNQCGGFLCWLLKLVDSELKFNALKIKFPSSKIIFLSHYNSTLATYFILPRFLPAARIVFKIEQESIVWVVHNGLFRLTPQNLKCPLTIHLSLASLWNIIPNLIFSILMNGSSIFELLGLSNYIRKLPKGD